jgi:hypothetical protein
LVFLNLAACVAYLLVFRVVDVPSSTFRQWFDIDSEHNLPTYLSGLQLFLIGALSAWRAGQRRPGDGAQVIRFYWVMAAGFLFLSIDEVAMIHEGTTSIMARLGVTSPFPGGFGLWILVYPVFSVAVLLLVWRGFLAFLSEKEGRFWFLLGAGLFVSGGILVEMGSYFFATPGESSQFYFTLVEECLEYAGQIAMIAAMLRRNRGSTLSLSAP